MILLPWIHNIELVDPYLSKGVNGHDITLNEEQGNAFLQGTGWGSVQSTELVLNNLFYLTATVYHSFLFKLKKIKFCFV